MEVVTVTRIAPSEFAGMVTVTVFLKTTPTAHRTAHKRIMLNLIRKPVAEYRDRVIRKQIFSSVSEADLLKLAVATAILDQIELVQSHVPKLITAAKVLVLSRKAPTCE